MTKITLTPKVAKTIVNKIGDVFFLVSDFEYGDTFDLSVTEVKKSPYSACFYGKVTCRGKKSGVFYALVRATQSNAQSNAQVRGDFQVFHCKKELDYFFRLNTTRTPRRD